MKYMGSKAKHAKELIPIITAGRAEGQYYVEPFVGGANMIDKIDGPRFGNDMHPQLIELLRAVRDGWIPPEHVSEAEYAAAREAKSVDALTGFIGFGASYSGKWFGGYARGNDHFGNPRNYADESRRNILKQVPGLQGVGLSCGPYADMDIPTASIIYCDPPYADATGYATGGFDHVEFWAWCDSMVAAGHKVFVSEYRAPDGWRCVWQKTVHNTLIKDTGAKTGVERLFTKDAS